MKITTTILGAMVVPALAYAQTAPEPEPQPQAQVQVQTPPPPTVVVNPQQPTAPAPTAYVAPEGDYEYDNWNAPVFTTSALVFAGSYGASAIVAGSSNHPGADRLYVPVVGPWLALNDWGNCPIENPSCDKTTTDKVLLVADGVFQAASLIGMIDGILSPTRHRVVATRTVDIVPTHNGAVVFGRF